MAAVGYGHVTPRRVLNRLYGVMHPSDVVSPPPEPPREVKETKESTRKAEGISLSGVDGVLMRFAQCCNPLPGEAIVGYISRGMGITVHRRDCPNVANMESERLINVSWDGQEEKPYTAGIFVISMNQKGALANIANVIAQYNVNINGLVMETTIDGKAKLHFKVEVRSAPELYRMIEGIRTLQEVLEVIRESEDEDM